MFYFDDGKSITVFFKSGESAVWQASNPNYAVVRDLAEKSEWIAIETLNNASKAVIEGTVEIKDNKVVAHTEDVTLTIELPKDNKFVKFVKLLKNKGVVDTRIEEITPFIRKLIENKFIDAVEEVYDFCSKGDFEITKDGNLIAYKKVLKDLGSVHDGKLNTTDFSAMTNGKVKVVKSKKKKLEDQKEARQDAHAGSRLQQTAELMTANGNDVNKVARIMGISPKTVHRNMQKLRKKEKEDA